MTYVFPVDYALAQYPAIHLDPITSARVLHGNMFCYQLPIPQPPPQLVRIYDATGRFLALAIWNTQQQMWQPTKVFTA
jgi:tRNA pseudouridine55 synthase